MTAIICIPEDRFEIFIKSIEETENISIVNHKPYYSEQAGENYVKFEIEYLHGVDVMLLGMTYAGNLHIKPTKIEIP